MVSRDLVASKLADLGDRVARVRGACSADVAALASDRDALDLVSFNLMLAVQVCADIASHVIADERWPVARTLGEGFDRLAEHGVIDEPTTAGMKRAVGLRNVVAHGYATVDVATVYEAATDGLADLESFARQVGAWLAAQPDG